jgi:hypothetical protein
MLFAVVFTILYLLSITFMLILAVLTLIICEVLCILTVILFIDRSARCFDYLPPKPIDPPAPEPPANNPPKPPLNPEPPTGPTPRWMLPGWFTSGSRGDPAAAPCGCTEGALGIAAGLLIYGGLVATDTLIVLERGMQTGIILSVACAGGMIGKLIGLQRRSRELGGLR